MSELHKVIMIGPVYPFIGGIAHYTNFMYQELSKSYDVSMISFQLQYPKFLHKKAQKDYSNKTFKIDSTQFLVNTINPFNWFKTAHKIKKLKPDLIIMQWWHPYFAPCYYNICKVLKNTKILFICHNVFPHERFLMDRFLTKLVLRLGDSYIVHSDTDAQDLLSIIPNANYKRNLLPTYNEFKFKNLTKMESRKILKIEEEKRVILFFGFVRKYKGLKYLIEALRLVVNELGNVELLIVGDFGKDKDEYLEQIKDYNLDEFIKIYEGYIPDTEVEKFFSACDVVALPYESATQSAVVQIAFDFLKPVIVTNVGGLPFAVQNGITGYVVESQNAEMLANAIIDYFKLDKQKEFSCNIKRSELNFSWDKMAKQIEVLWEQMN